MLSKDQIRLIHIHKSKSGLSDDDYRKLLYEVTGAVSSKDDFLSDTDLKNIVSALSSGASANTQKSGWKIGQIKKFKQYCNYCQMDADNSRAFLFRATGYPNEGSPQLNNHDFEHVMSTLEHDLAQMVARGDISQPAGIEIDYWRQRIPSGGLSSRQDWEIRQLFEKLKDHLPEEKRTHAYLHSIIAKTLGSKRQISDLAQLKSYQGIKVIDALKQRLMQEERKINEVPF